VSSYQAYPALNSAYWSQVGRNDGTEFLASTRINAIYDNDGNHIGFAVVTRDLTEKPRT